ncbi:hypothetical protein ACHQM5_030840 [Ranunculus cassubicifolius]
MTAIVLRNPRTYLIRLFSCSSIAKTIPAISYRVARRSIQRESDADNIAKTFLDSTYQPRSCQDRNLFSVCVTKLGQLQRFDLVEKILENHKQTTWLKNEVYWIPIINIYSNAQMLDQAIRIFDQMGVIRTEKSFCAILSACLENTRFDLVHEFFESVPSKIGIVPGVVAYNLVMRAFVAENKLDSAMLLLRKMEDEKGLTPYVSSYNVMLTGYLKYGEDGKFDELYKEFTEKGFEPNLVSYNLRIARLCKSKECVRAKELLDEMTSKGVKPNVTSYNTVIDGFCKIADFESAKGIFGKMRAEEDEYVSPNKDSYFILIRHLVKEREFESALEVCNESLQRKWIPPFASIEGLVRGLVKLSKENEAKEIVENMKKRLRPSALVAWAKVEGVLPLQ